MYYRYLSARWGLEALRTGLWKIGRLHELNDPLDCYPVFYSSSGKVVPRDIDNRPKILLRIFLEIGVLCYGSTIVEPDVWTFYGDKHRGLAFGFEFEGIDKPVEVTYSQERQKVDWDEVERCLAKNEESAQLSIMIQAVTHKYERFRNESEHRYFIRLSGCIKTDDNHRKRRPPYENLRQVVLGMNSSLTDQEVYRALPTVCRDRVVVHRMEPDPCSYQLRVQQ